MLDNNKFVRFFISKTNMLINKFTIVNLVLTHTII